MRLNSFKVIAILILLAVTCVFCTRHAAAQIGFGKPDDQPPTPMPKPVPLTHRFELYYDGQTTANSALKKDVIAPQELQQTPIYENAPFLRLKPGDKLCTGIEHFEGKGQSEDIPYYYLHHDEKYYELEMATQNTKLRLSDARLSLLFDWDVSLETAGQLRQLYGPPNEVSVAPERYNALKTAVRQKFPDIACEDSKITVRKPFLEGEGKRRHAVFEGLAYDSRKDIVYAYQLQIGNQVLQEYRENLIVGPPHIEREEFEGTEPGNGMNAGPGHKIDAQTAAIKRAAYQRMLTFLHVVQPFLPGGDRVGATEGFGF